MGASDYMVGDAPLGANYAAPLVNFAPISQLGDDYIKGTQQRRQRDMQTAFPDGMPTKPDGSPDVNAVINKGVKIGGLEYAQPLMQMLLAGQVGAQAAQGLGALDSTVTGAHGPAPAPAPNAAAGSPASLRPVPQARNAPAQPALSSAGTDNNGADTTRSLATEVFGGRDVSALIPRFAKSLGADPDAPLTPAQVAQAKTVMGKTKAAMALTGNPPAPSPAPDNGAETPADDAPASASGNNPPFAPGLRPAQPPAATTGAAPVAAPGGSPAQAPAPVPARQPVAQPQPAAPATPGNGENMLSGLSPQDTAEVQRLRFGATKARAAAAQVAAYNPATAQQYEKVADAYEARANTLVNAAIAASVPPAEQRLYEANKLPGESFVEFQARKTGATEAATVAAKNKELPPEQRLYNANKLPGESYVEFQARTKGATELATVAAKNQELTPEQKNANASGLKTPAELKTAEEQSKDDTTRYGKMLSSIQGSASAANRMLPHIAMAESLYNDPNFYSGTGENLSLMYKKAVNALNPNNTEALPQEAFRKTMAAAILNQVEQLKDDTSAVGGGGRIFQSQIELMEKAANNPDNSVPANRLLTEISKRAALESKKIASMANSYKGGHLDAKFAQMVDDYYTAHPMFTPDEMEDVRRIAPPVVRGKTQAELLANLHKIGWKDGEPFRGGNGKIYTHAPGSAPETAKP